MCLTNPILAILAVLAATTVASLITPDLNVAEISALLAGAGPVIPQAMTTTEPLAVLPSNTHLYPWDISTHFITRTRAAEVTTSPTTTANTISSEEQHAPTALHFHHKCTGSAHLPPSPPYRFHHGPHCFHMTKRHRSITATAIAAVVLPPSAAEATRAPAQQLLSNDGLSSQTTTITTTTTTTSTKTATVVGDSGKARRSSVLPQV